MAIVSIVLNGAWALAVFVLAAVLFGFNLLSIMWGQPCSPADAPSLGLFCSATSWAALGIAVSGVLVTGLLQAIAYPVLWRRSIVLMPAVIGLALTAATGTVAWTYAQAGLG